MNRKFGILRYFGGYFRSHLTRAGERRAMLVGGRDRRTNVAQLRGGGGGGGVGVKKSEFNTETEATLIIGVSEMLL